MSKISDIKVGLGNRSYNISIAAGLLDNSVDLLEPHVSGRKCLLVSDSNVYRIYGERAEKVLEAAGASVENSVFQAGEDSKNLKTMGDIYHDAISCGLDRTSVIVALGGGVCGDIAGFAAATFMRGIDFIQMPTSLLAMVDSSVGGKTGVDLPEGKNLVGAFWQPKAVIIDPELLTTLPERELRSGLAEVVKYAMIADKDLFDILESNVEELKLLDLEFYSRIIARCCEIKAKVVAQDERESGVRALLNYGHTFGHGIEQVSNFAVTHGEGVAIGMHMAAGLAERIGLCPESVVKRQRALLEKLSLPTAVCLNPEMVFQTMKNDKKKSGGQIVVVLPEKVGKADIFRNVPAAAIHEAVKRNCHNG